MDHLQASVILGNIAKGHDFPANSGEIAVDCARLLLKSSRKQGFHPGLPTFQLLQQLISAPERELAAEATNCLYQEVIEPLCDDFTRSGCEQAHLILAELLVNLAGGSQGQALAKSLQDNGLTNTSRILEHWKRAVSPLSFPGSNTLERLEKIMIPSRISVGADVVITSVLIKRLRRALPNTDIVLVGPGHLHELFSDLDGISHLPFSIERQGSISQRLLYWPDLLAATKAETKHSGPEKVMVLDPDSRLTQLGMLPLTIGANVCQFPSQTMGETGIQQSLSKLVNLWLDELLGQQDSVYPFVSPPAKDRENAAAFCNHLRSMGAERLILVNLGVGGNDRKRLPDQFEEKLLQRLLEREKTIIILDTGCGSEEKSRAEKWLNLLGTDKSMTLTSSPRDLSMMSQGIIGICASMGELAAVCGEVDGYLGYDSCGQHLANAVGTPGVTLFNGYPNQRFLARWSPLGRKNCSLVIPVNQHEPNRAELSGIIDKSLLALNHLTLQRQN